MKKVVYILGCVFFFALESCIHNKSENLNNIKEYSLEHSFCCDLMISSGRMQMVDSFLVIVSHEQDKICSVYEIGDEVKEIYNYGSIGNGPKDFLQPMLTGAYKNEFTLNEINKRELVILSILDSVNGLIIEERTRLRAPYKPSKDELVLSDIAFARLDDEHYVSMTSSGNGRFFTLSDSFIQPIMRFGDSPILEELPPIVSRNRLGGLLAASNGRMVFAATKMPYLASYSLKENIMKKNWDLFYYETNFSVSKGDLLFDREKALGPLLDLKMDSKYIYVCYMDQPLSEYDYNQTDKSCADKILVFNHEGQKIAIVDLDCRINAMAIDRNKGFIWAIAQNPDMSLVKFVMPEELCNN